MPNLDMPIKELEKYTGTNPMPADFDAYWDRAVAEMKSVDPKVELVPADFELPRAECFDLYFTGVGNARIHAKYIRPKYVPEPHPAVIRFHGYFDYSGPWNGMLPFVSQGYSMIYMDARGQAGESEDTSKVKGTTFCGHIVRGLSEGPEKLLFRSIFLDAAELAGIVMNLPEVDPERVGILGDSQGGALTVACAALEPRVKKAAPLYPFLSDYQRVWEMDLAKGSYLELSTYLRQRDPLHEHEKEIFTTLGYIDVMNLAHRIKAEILLGTGLLDDTVPASTQYALYSKLKGKKQHLVYPDYGHEPIHHFADRAFQFLLDM